MFRFVAALAALTTGLLVFVPSVAGAPSSWTAREPEGELRLRVTADRAVGAVQRRRYVVAAIGDSLTDPRSGGGVYLRELAKRCPESRFDAYGVGGQQTNHMRWRLDQDLFGAGMPHWAAKKPRYTHVVILGGVNDLSGGSTRSARIERTSRNLAAMYDRARARGVEVVAMTLPPWTGLRNVQDARSQATRDLNAWILAQHAGGRVSRAVDIFPLLSCGEPDVLCPELRRYPNDLVHWGQRGHARVAKALGEQVFADCR